MPRRRASWCWAAGVACHRQLWHSTPTLRTGSARSSSASRLPSRSRTGNSSTRRMPAAARIRPAMRWNQLRGSRASTRSPSSMSRAGGPARPRWRQAWATRRSSSGSTPRRRAPSSACAVGPMPTAGASRASVAAIDRTGMAVDLDDVLGDVTARAVHGDAQPLVRVGALDAEDVDDVVTVEAVEPVQAGRRAMGHAHDAGGAGRRPSPGGRTSSGAPPTVSTPGARRVQRAVGEQSPLDPPADAERPGLRRRGDAVLTGHQLQQSSHALPGRGERGEAEIQPFCPSRSARTGRLPRTERRWARLRPWQSCSTSIVATTASPSSRWPTARSTPSPRRCWPSSARPPPR